MTLDLRRLHLGEAICAIGAIALIVLELEPWYSRQEPRAFDLTAWQAFTVEDILFLALAAMALAMVLATATQRSAALPLAASVIVTVFAVAMLLVLLYRIIDEPGPDDAVAIEFGAYAGLAAIGAIAFGAFQAMADERV